MSHPEARRRATMAGAEVVASPAADLVVVGEGTGEGRREQLAVDPVECIDEVAFLRALGLVAEDGPLYSLARLSALLEVEPASLRSWVREGLLEPAQVVGRLCLFDFRSLALARRLARLCASGMGTSRIRRSLERASRWLPAGEAGPDLIEAPAPAGVALRLSDGRLADPDGQLLMDFERPADAVPARALPHPGDRKDADGDGDAEGWFERGLGAETDGRLEDAVAAYRRSLELAEEPETWFNLGNCLWLLDRRQDSVDAYRRALDLDAEYAEAWNNLGNALSELGRGDEAVIAYRRALGISPWYADARFNLEETLAGLGEDTGAR